MNVDQKHSINLQRVALSALFIVFPVSAIGFVTNQLAGLGLGPWASLATGSLVAVIAGLDWGTATYRQLSRQE